MLIVLSTTTTSFAFIHPDGSEDDNFEIFGPRIDRILIRKYANLDAEIAALQSGEIDITDWALTKTEVDTLSTDPNIGLESYGGEACYYTMNFNLNNNSCRGNPPDPAYANPVFPNPMSELALRQACAYLVNRTALYNGPWQDRYEPIFTPIPAYMKYWIHPEIRSGGALEGLTYPYNITKAAEVLDSGGFPMGPDGFRYWDRDRDGLKDPDESFQLKWYTRGDILRKSASDMLNVGFLDPQIRIPHIRYEVVSGYDMYRSVYEEKDYHIYTAGWIFIGPEPEHLRDLYHWSEYWHPGDCPNFGSVSIDDPIMQAQLETIKFSTNQTEALEACLAFQERFATTVSEIPLGVWSSPKAYNKWYTGGNDGVVAYPDDGENAYRGQMWTHLVNQAGSGENSWWTTLNAHPENAESGNGHLTMRYGWKDLSQPAMVNPMYSSWYWDRYEVIGRIYDCLGARNPVTMGPYEAPQLVDNWTVGVWTDPRDGLAKSAVDIKIRPDVLWSDGAPFTVDDIIYTFVDLPIELQAAGCPEVWWQPTVNQIAAVYRLDQYSARILCTPSMYLTPQWILGNIVVPKHIWQPFIASHTPTEIVSDIAPQYLVGTGPFIYVENTPTTLTMVRNPLYAQRTNTAVMRYENSAASKIAEGITVAALTPSIQLRPFKIQSSLIFPASVRLTVPVTNLDVDNSCIIHETAELLRHNGSIQTLLDANKSLTALQVSIDSFDVYDLENGQHNVRVTVEVTGGALYDYVTANLPSEVWQFILGPRTVQKSFWITILADIDENGTVDILDIVLIATNFGKSIGETGFTSEGDLNMDGTVDIFDIVLVAINFSWHY